MTKKQTDNVKCLNSSCGLNKSCGRFTFELNDRYHYEVFHPVIDEQCNTVHCDNFTNKENKNESD